MNRSCCNRDGSESYFTSRYESLDSRLAICLLKAERRHRKRGVSLTFQLVAFAKDFKWHHCRQSKDIPHRKPAGYSFNTNECERMTELTSPRRAAEPFIWNKLVDYKRSSGAGVILTFSYWGKTSWLEYLRWMCVSILRVDLMWWRKMRPEGSEQRLQRHREPIHPLTEGLLSARGWGRVLIELVGDGVNTHKHTHSWSSHAVVIFLCRPAGPN